MPVTRQYRAISFMVLQGGRNASTWAAGWNSGATKVIRVPEVLADEIMNYARALDNGESLLQGNEREIILNAIARFIELRAAQRHANQFTQGKEFSTQARTWDELKKFTKMVNETPQKLGLSASREEEKPNEEQPRTASESR